MHEDQDRLYRNGSARIASPVMQLAIHEATQCRYRQQAIVLNRWACKELGPEDARALIRHAFGRFYRDFSMVDTHDKPLVTEYTWLDTLTG